MEAVATLETSETLAELVASGHPDVVVMDLSLGDGESLPAVQSLMGKEPEARVLMYSGHSDQQVVDRCVEAGAWGFVGKDAEPSIVLEAIRRIARGEAVFPSWATSG
jgi:DNA-binding NarL/FixJ family response regulator